ncbi:MAG: ROK family transcriptional regulator [Thermogemmatispora sp.]|jgi:glucokinase-like ROK family protein|uniref:ROK family transcriptional regulator n=1 Tax=Thermogemmatispora sp. TaxID=1968838 RepID=UPI0019EA7125|nr:ROK family transcriptional regulator [Thermogemmatispora sp.]MBE3568423.1 ROK family transcriptional regulator [Thermogemmatispora sp.]
MTTSLTRHGLREVNREQVLRIILREGPLARIDLAHRTGLTAAAISNITRELIEDGLLREVGPAPGKRVGASAILLDLPDDGPLIGAVHQGVSALRLALCTLRGRVVVRSLVSTPRPLSPDETVALIGQKLHDLLADNGYTKTSLLGVGAGVVGLVDSERALVKRAPRLGWEKVPLGDLLAERLGCPVALDNNVRAMALGEALLGQGRFWPDFAFVYVGTGIGSGLIINGYPYRGAHGSAGEIGHITVDPEGERCACGNRGCLETIAAEPAIVRLASLQGLALQSEAASPKEAVRRLASLARQGDEAARAVVRTCGESLGIALSTLTDILNPSRIVLHGAIAEAGDLFFSAVATCLHQRAFLTRDETIELVAPTFGEDAGLVGAASVALEALVLRAAGRER